MWLPVELHGSQRRPTTTQVLRKGRGMRRVVCFILAATAVVGLAGRSLAASHRSPVSRTAQIYSAAIRQLITVDCNGADANFEAVYVLNGPVPGAGDANLLVDDWRPSQPFKSRVVNALTAELEDLPAVSFVEDRSAVVEGPEPGQVIQDGVLVTLDRIAGGRGRVEVPISCWVNGLAGHWLTYVVQRTDGRWQVTGTTGPIAIS